MAALRTFIVLGLAVIASGDECVEGSVCAETEMQVSFLQEAQRLRVHEVPQGLALKQEFKSPTDVQAATGLDLNGQGDLSAFLASTMVNIVTCLICILIFTYCLRLNFPAMFSNNFKAHADIFPESMNSKTYWGWISQAWNVSMEQTSEGVGLDAAMMIEFCNLAMEIFGIISIPMVFVLGGMNWAFGGHVAVSRLSVIGINNVEDGSWLTYVHGFAVWGVVYVVITRVYAAQKMFVGLRFEWLLTMDDDRACTLMVENIPEEFRSNKALEDFFEDMIEGDQVDTAYVVKDTTQLESLTKELEAAKFELKTCNALWDRESNDPNKRPKKYKFKLFGSETDLIDHYTKLVADLEAKVAAEKSEVLKAAETIGGVNLGAGFVRFHNLQYANLALQLQLSSNLDEWQLAVPPDPLDLRWIDLTRDTTAQFARNILGALLIVALFLVYLPCCVAITNLAIAVDLGPFQPIWAGLAPTMGLTIMVMFLPTLLMLIFRSCFLLYADQWAQEVLQSYYFWFQVFFVVLTPALGSNFIAFLKEVAEDPYSLFVLLADKIPDATHFYLNFMVLQWSTLSLNILRYTPLFKYEAFASLFDQEDARKLAEPEDQDYYGIGSRSARFATFMVTGLVYGQLTPLITILTFILFALQRLVYGYLLNFAETKKNDMGGAFWVKMLKHTMCGLLIYCVIMAGVLAQKGPTIIPCLLCVPPTLYALVAMWRFERQFAWRKLSQAELMGKSTILTDQKTKLFKMRKRETDGEYVQPELST